MMPDLALADRMKLYESAESERRLMPLLPVVARIDGRAFHSFTQGMDRPFDRHMVACMEEATAALVEETCAAVGYTQSDEITLVWHAPDPGSEIWFNGKVLKMASNLASTATVEFYRQVQAWLPRFADRKPTFDARVWSVPTRAEAANVLRWREQDAVKNSITALASAYYSHAELQGKNSRDRLAMLQAKGVSWEAAPTAFKRGTYFARRKVRRRFTAEEIERLPPRHAARTEPELVVERTQLTLLSLPPLDRLANLEGVLFGGEEPALKGTGRRPAAPLDEDVRGGGPTAGAGQ